jgi:hypothetical protein
MANNQPPSGGNKAAQQGSGTGTPNTKSIGASAKKWANTLNPWGGPNIPKTPVNRLAPSGSSMRKPIPDPSLKGMDYPPNDPLLWPVVPNWDGSYTRQPSASGINSAVIAKNNSAVEEAYHRAGYQ